MTAELGDECALRVFVALVAADAELRKINTLAADQSAVAHARLAFEVAQIFIEVREGKL